MIALVLLIPFMAAMNSFAGGRFPFGERTSVFSQEAPGRPIFFAAPIVAFVLWAFFGLPGLIAGLSFLLWRLPGWYGGLDGGSMTHTADRDFLVMAGRGVLAFPMFFYKFEWENLPLFFCFCVLIGTSYVMSAIIADYRWDPITAAEWMVGAVWGVTFWMLFVR